MPLRRLVVCCFCRCVVLGQGRSLVFVRTRIFPALYSLSTVFPAPLAVELAPPCTWLPFAGTPLLLSCSSLTRTWNCLSITWYMHVCVVGCGVFVCRPCVSLRTVLHRRAMAVVAVASKGVRGCSGGSAGGGKQRRIPGVVCVAVLWRACRHLPVEGCRAASSLKAQSRFKVQL